ncbi:tyrosine-type recombinase/integrase [Microvirga arabica]|uniref:tyrosine-type recombinase/integrase n=1 Tax=Microvirga arabica TaxID=1128671 RepID=UPI00193ADD7C|nr:tyrosine-type recombinase/integrase [Microvirga arabica]MBM1174292.1 tyrosine-type recombinase/integrase [Microvirga arabica]
MSKFANIDTPAKRSKLAAAKNPYWRGIGHGRGGLYLGYRKPLRGAGTWVAKIVQGGRRAEERIGLADDMGAAAEALGYAAAVRAALSWAEGRERAFAALDAGDANGLALTVREAVNAYIKVREARSKRAGADAKSRLTLHVLSDPKISDLRLSRVTASALKEWRKRLSPELRPATVNRLLNDLRAALNTAIDEHRRVLGPHIRDEVKVGTKALLSADEARERQILTAADVRTLTAAAFDLDETADLGRFVLVLAATGARFSQVARLRVRDVLVNDLRIMVPRSAKGKGAKSATHIGVPVGEDVIERLRPILHGRKGHEALLERWRHRQVAPIVWERVERSPWRAAAELTRPWKEIVVAANLPIGTIPYSLRHTSIVRMLRANVSTRFVALAHDTSVAMIEKHYAAYVLDDVSDIVRRAVEPVAPAAPARLHVV